MTTYIYGLRCPISDEIRYIGKSNNPGRRLLEHVRRARENFNRSNLSAWIHSLSQEGYSPALVILESVTGGRDWRVAEREHIAVALSVGSTLLNATTGGEGFCPLTANDEKLRRERISSAHLLRLSDPEVRQAAVAKLKQSISPEVVCRRAATLKRTLSTDAAKKARHAQVSEVAARPEVRLAKSVASKITWSDPEHREAVSATMREKWSDPAYVKRVADGQEKASEKMSLAAKSRLSDPASYTAMVEHRRTPEYRAMMAEKTRLSWEKRRLKAAAQNSNSQAA